ncbi:MAG: hypothetical protein HY741_23940 [Chloroflexi bacterium]|nr:hypothetical protein [Chloroflexota bacterium]
MRTSRLFSIVFGLVISVGLALPFALPPASVAAAGGCRGAPQLNGFWADPPTIQYGESTTLRWGLVANADAAVLVTPYGNAGVATPGEQNVRPNDTTTYTLQAWCKGHQVQAQVVVNVVRVGPLPPPPPPSEPSRIESVKVEKEAMRSWKVMVRYYWNGEGNRTRIVVVGVRGNTPVTDQAEAKILPNFVST